MLSIFMRLKILRFRFGAPRTKFDEWERIKNRACKNAATTCSAYFSCSGSVTVTLRVPYSTDDLSQFVSARSN